MAKVQIKLRLLFLFEIFFWYFRKYFLHLQAVRKTMFEHYGTVDDI